MSPEVVSVTADQARDLTDRIKIAVDGTWQLIKQAYESRAWSALGYRTWDEYCTREFGTSRLRLPREERQEVVASLREIGMSVRAIASATGDHYSTVSRELARVAPATRADDEDERDLALAEARTARDTGQRIPLAEATTEVGIDEADLDDEDRPEPTPRPVIGTDGKRYTAQSPKPPQKPRTDVVATVNRALQRAQEAAQAADGITRQHLAGRSDEAAGWYRSLVASLESLHGLRDLLEDSK